MKLAPLLLILLAGCSMIDNETPAPDGWPELRVVLMEGEINCKAGAFVIACMQPNFDTRECYVWMQKDAPRWVKEHEEAHCRGHDHYGDSILRDYFRQWRNRGGS